MKKEMTSYHVGVSAEAFVAAQFARLGFHVAVQYGANQPGYDLMIEKSGKTFMISVKGSQDNGWGITQSFIKNADYINAIDDWKKKQNKGIIFCFVQFYKKRIDQMPEMYLSTVSEIAEHLKKCRDGHGDTILWVCKKWATGKHAGHIDAIPDAWKLTKERAEKLIC